MVRVVVMRVIGGCSSGDGGGRHRRSGSESGW